MNRLDALMGALDASVRDRVTAPEMAIMFSGGVDSCVIASLASRYAKVMLYTVGLEGAHDLRVAQATAKQMGLEWNPVLLNEEEVRRGVREVARSIGTDSPLTISFEMPLYFVARAAMEENLLCGQGADEIFAGYARYAVMTPLERRLRMHQDTDDLLNKGVPCERRLASLFGKTIGHPFLDHRVVDQAEQLPDEMLVQDGVRKVALRRLADALGLEAAGRPKKAAQYGSGIMKSMKGMAKRDGLTLREWTLGSIDEDEGR